jgi:leader peptidase (prepilin peptidase) / N-methyltransferase
MDRWSTQSERLMRAPRGAAYSSDMSRRTLVQTHGLNALTALLFGLAVWRIGFSPELPAVLAFIFGGVLLAAIDWKIHRLPTRLVYLTLAGVTGGLLFASLVEWEWMPLATAAAGAALFSGAFFTIWVVTQRLYGFVVLGLGDVRLAAVLGALLGWYGLEYVLYGALAGHLLAVVIGVAVALSRRTFRMTYAFGPSLIAGTLAVVLVHV